jgi:hypothetical protein
VLGIGSTKIDRCLQAATGKKSKNSNPKTPVKPSTEEEATDIEPGNFSIFGFSRLQSRSNLIVVQGKVENSTRIKIPRNATTFTSLLSPEHTFAMADQAWSDTIKDNPIRKGLDIFRASFTSVCDNQSIPLTLDLLGKLGHVGNAAQFCWRVLLTILQSSRTPPLSFTADPSGRPSAPFPPRKNSLQRAAKTEFGDHF